ncbi:MAG: ATP-binding protein [Verrucomicrobiota bacterium]|nr:ATP-binding protein [Verrucomicrobiota bacterium]
MRDLGYSLETALADIVDNSITAGSTSIRLFVSTDSASPQIAILDDGHGMDSDEILAAMRLGSRSPLDEREQTDLGRFGLGLKTASFSQCRRLSLVSRKNGRTSAAIWDFARVAQTDKWQVEIPDTPEVIPWVNKLGDSGTLVLWENLDRVVQEGSDDAIAHFIKRVDEARSHLELVFHRFLTGEPGHRKIQMFLNERPLESFDPFHSSHPATDMGPLERIKVGAYEVTVQTFTLPHHKKVTPDEWERNAGPSGYVKNQGFYVYRQKRLIIHGTWFGLARQTELTKLARVRIDMPNGLDAAWRIDVKKASAQPPYQVKERLRRIIETLGANSKRVFTGKGHKLLSDNRLPVWNRMQDKGEIFYRINADYPMFAEFATRLPEGVRADFFRVLEVAGSTLPMDALFADLGGSPGKVSGNAISDESLYQALQAAVKRLKEGKISLADIKEMLQFVEPFRSNWERMEPLLTQLVE